MDDLWGAAQPKCPECGTLLRDVEAGYECKTCGLLYLRSQS